MKKIKNTLAGLLIAATLASCGTPNLMRSTSTPPEYAGSLESVKLMDRKKRVETSQGRYFPLKKYPKIQVGQDCYLIFERDHRGIFVAYLTTIDFATKETGKKYKVYGRPRAF